MLGESRLNVYILGAELPPRIRERLQAQVRTALRSLPPWTYDLLTRRIDELGVGNLPLIVEPAPENGGPRRMLGFGEIEGRPAARLLPCLRDDSIDWGHDQRYLLGKAVAFLAAPGPEAQPFWRRWAEAVEEDRLRSAASEIAAEWAEETDLGLLLEMFAAYALNPRHERWPQLPSVRRFLDEWRGPDA